MTVFYTPGEYFISLKEKLTGRATRTKEALIFHPGEGLREASFLWGGECGGIVRLAVPGRRGSEERVAGCENIGGIGF